MMSFSGQNYLSSNGKMCGITVMMEPMLKEVEASSTFEVADKTS